MPNSQSLTQPLKWHDLKVLCPLILGAACLVDAGLRFFPQSTSLSFRAWEPALSMATAEGVFRPLFVYDNPRAFGDLSNLANCESCRVYRHERFTTDERGYRNPQHSDGRYSMLLTGDSFAVGSGLNDQETLPVVLNQLLPGDRVYNGSGPQPNWPDASKLIAAHGIRDSVLIWEHAELHPFPAGSIEPPAPAGLKILRRVGGGKDSAVYQNLRGTMRWAREWLNFSPLKIAVQHHLRTLEGARILPAGSPARVSRLTLANGQSMLFYDLEIEAVRHPSKPDIGYFRDLRAAVHATGNELLVVLAPTKYTVYAPLLQNPPLRVPNSPLTEAEAELHSAGIPAVDLTPALRRQAAEALVNGQLTYHADDTHWNAAGVHEGAREIAATIQRLRRSGTSAGPRDRAYADPQR